MIARFPLPTAMVSLTTQDLTRIRATLGLLVGALDYASLDEWRTAVASHLKQLLDGDQVIFYSPPEQGESFWFSEEVSQDQLLIYEKVQTAGKDGGTEVATALGLEVVTTQSLIGDRWDLFFADLAVQEFHLPNGQLDTAGIIVPQLIHGGPPVGIEIHKSSLRRGRHGARSELLLGLLLPAFKAGLTSRFLAASQRGALGRMLDHLEQRAFLFSDAGTLVHRSPMPEVIGESPEFEVSLCATAAALARTLLAPVAPSGLPSAEAALTGRTGTWRLRGALVGGGLLLRGRAAMVLVEHIGSSTGDAAVLCRRFGLTRRELEVAELLATGLRTRAIADQLGISPNTVRRHTEAVFQKLGVSTRASVSGVLHSRPDTA